MYPLVESAQDAPTLEREYAYVDVPALQRRFRLRSFTAAEAVKLAQQQRRQVQMPDKSWSVVDTIVLMRERAIAAAVVDSKGKLWAHSFDADPDRALQKCIEAIGAWPNGAVLTIYNAVRALNGDKAEDQAAAGEGSGSSPNDASPSA